MFKDLMTSRRFAPLFWCQFCSALNDNFLKNALVILILFGFAGAGGAASENGPMLVTLAGIVFIAPFFVLSALGGELADRFDKASVAARIKLAEIPVAALAAAGFFLHSVEILFVTLGLFGVLAALFGPVKYGILPEKLGTAELSAGNALVEGATFLAILIGTIAGGIAVAGASGAGLVVAIILALAVASWGFARAIPAHGPADPGLAVTPNPWTSTVALLRELKGTPRLWSGGHIVSWFWLVGSVVLALLPTLVKDYVGGSEDVVTLCLTTFVVGIAAGSALGAGASHGKPNLALVPLGAALMGIFALALAGIASLLVPGTEKAGPGAVLATATGLALLASLCGIAVSGGLFIVPAFASVQAWSPPEARARVIAAVNVMNAAYMVAGGAILAGLQASGAWLSACCLGFNPFGLPMLFAVLGVLSLGAVLYVRHAWGVELGRSPALETHGEA